ncbi:MAG: hypothetical protein ACI9HK_005150 [Pirellulaceae bacterium]|jgi:hypothetical protein
MANQLKVAKVLSIETLHAQGWSQRRIARELGINRETVARYLKELASSAECPPTDLGSKPAKAPTGSDASVTSSKPAKAPTGSRSKCRRLGSESGSQEPSDLFGDHQAIASRRHARLCPWPARSHWPGSQHLHRGCHRTDRSLGRRSLTQVPQSLSVGDARSGSSRCRSNNRYRSGQPRPASASLAKGSRSH